MDNVILNQNIHFKCSFSFDFLHNIRYSSLVFSYSTAKYWSRICCRSRGDVAPIGHWDQSDSDVFPPSRGLFI